MARKTQKLFILALLLISSISISYFNFIGNSKYQVTQDDQSHIKISQGAQNYTIETYLPSLIWFEPQLRLNISTNQTGSIQCFFSEIAGAHFFSTGNYSLSLVGNNISEIFYLQLIPLITTLPGIYQFSLNITGVFSYSEIFEIVYGLGVISLFLVFSVIIIIPLIIIFKKSKGLKQEKLEVLPYSDKSETIMSRIPGKINCPNCHKSIDEGLVFCPECGDRIPEFLRYNPPSGI